MAAIREDRTRKVTIDARPRPMTIDPRQTAVIVVDMQNDFGAENGMFARAGIDVSSIQRAVAPIAGVLQTARRAGMAVVFLKMEFAPDLSNAGHDDAPNRVLYDGLGVGEIVTAPDGRESRVMIRDTWNTEILPQLQPLSGDHVVSKYRFSGFFETNLDSLLKNLGISTLVVTGCTTSVCVESTIRDAFFRDYRCLLLADCTAEPIGASLPRSNYDATLHMVEEIFGWVSDSTRFEQAMAELPVSSTVG